MKLHLSNISGINLFTGYGEGYVMVNRQRYARNLVVLRERLVTDWQPAGFDQLGSADFSQLAELKPEIVLLGTGARLRFPRPELTRALLEARIGLEVMDIQAACRTYNILAAEERKVAAALLFT
ncbi:MAG: Mth938-like domain-containing protein [Burkholderiales bacterium]|nr:Mth938-like domain-containing protein [Burkholderiales bacterium]